MTEQSPPGSLNRASNDILEATSFLSGTNAIYVERLYAQYLADPNSVEQSWRDYFAGLGEGHLTATQLGQGPAFARGKGPALPADDNTLALSGQQPAPKAATAKAAKPVATEASAKADAAASIHAVQMIRAYRMIGHFEAELDPLGLTPRTPQVSSRPPT